MATTYGRFPGVQVEVAGGGITSVAIGEEEKLVLFGEANYENDGNFPGDGNTDSLVSEATGSTNEPFQINARRQADVRFGEGSKLADGMREALANSANISFLYGVAPERVNVVDESLSSQTGTLDNSPIYEDNVGDESNIENVTVDDVGASSVTVEFSYDGAPATPSADDTIVINPLTGEYAADAAPSGSNYNISYKYLDWESAFTASDVVDVVEESETGIYCPLTDADSVSSTLDTEVSSLREEQWKLVNALSGAEPNDNEVVTTDGDSLQSDHSNYQRRDARYDTNDYDQANQSVDADYYFKVAPARLEDEKRTGLGGVAGLFAGNPISDPIYNDQVEGYDGFEQSLSKLEADNMRDENIIPIRQAGSTRVRDNVSTSTEEDWERDFWRRRIADRVILIGKLVGDSIIGQINDPNTRDAAQRLIRQEMRELVADRLLRPNAEGEENWYVEVYEDSDNPDQVNIDIGFTPYGIVKRVNETITINT